MGFSKSENVGFLVNNMGCCLFEAEKREQAYDYFKIAFEILSETRGLKNEHTICVQNNIERLLSNNLQFAIEKTDTFKFFHQDFLKVVRVKKQNKK